MSITKDITGQKFSRLTAIKFLFFQQVKGGKNKSVCLFKCDCGKDKIVFATAVKTGNTKSCGCLHKENSLKSLSVIIPKVSFIKANDLKSEYLSWTHMKARCTNEKRPDYKYYGGRGIEICDRWVKSFKDFLEDMGKKPTPQHTLDRIDFNGNYCKENCRWATRTEQMRNVSTNKYIEFRGEKLLLNDACEKYCPNHKISTIYQRINRGKWNLEDALINHKKNG